MQELAGRVLGSDLNEGSRVESVPLPDLMLFKWYSRYHLQPSKSNYQYDTRKYQSCPWPIRGMSGGSNSRTNLPYISLPVHPPNLQSAIIISCRSTRISISEASNIMLSDP